MVTGFRCGVDLVEISQVQQLVESSSTDDLRRIFSEHELSAAGVAKTRYAKLAARFAAKEACLKLFPAETATTSIDCSDFSVDNDAYGAPFIKLSAKARALLDRHGNDAISISLSHTHHQAMAMAVAIRKDFEAPLLGKLIYRLLPLRRRLILANLQRVYGNTLTPNEIRAIAQAHYAHFVRMGLEFVQFQFLSRAQRQARARVENAELIINTLSRGQGAIILTGHFGNFATAIAAAAASFPEARGRFYFVRRPLQPPWVDALIGKHFERSGFHSLPKRGSMEAILDCLEAGNALVFPFDQHTSGRKSVTVEFFGHPVGTFRSLALIALTSGAPVFPASSWRDENGKQVVRFEEPLQLIHHANAREEIHLNTRLFNEALERMILRHPDQWWWVHRRFRH